MLEWHSPSLSFPPYSSFLLPWYHLSFNPTIPQSSLPSLSPLSFDPSSLPFPNLVTLSFDHLVFPLHHSPSPSLLIAPLLQSLPQSSLPSPPLLPLSFNPSPPSPFPLPLSYHPLLCASPPYITPLLCTSLPSPPSLYPRLGGSGQ